MTPDNPALTLLETGYRQPVEEEEEKEEENEAHTHVCTRTQACTHTQTHTPGRESVVSGSTDEYCRTPSDQQNPNS